MDFSDAECTRQFPSVASSCDAFSDDEDDFSERFLPHFFHDEGSEFGKARSRVRDKFLARIKKLNKSTGKGKNGFDDEYFACCEVDLLPQYVNNITHQTKATQQKNRYYNVLPYESTRVRLPYPSKKGESGDYINANYICGENLDSENGYIACSAPIPQAMDDFWCMVYHLDVRVILMLTNFVERNQLKADYYWPKDGKEVFFNDIGVRVVNEEVASVGYIIRTFHIRMANQDPTNPRVIKHIQLTSWPDHGVLKDFSVIHPMLKHFNFFRHDLIDDENATNDDGCGSLLPKSLNIRLSSNSQRKKKYPPAVVHCSAGIGRSGTFLTIDLIIKRIFRAMELVSDSSDDKKSEEQCLVELQKALDVPSIVQELRKQRPGMVQTSRQYQMIYDYIAEILM